MALVVLGVRGGGDGFEEILSDVGCCRGVVSRAWRFEFGLLGVEAIEPVYEVFRRELATLEAS